MVYFQKAGRYILKDVDLYIPKGVAVGVIGASGAGKTTLLKLACGLLACEHGTVHTLGMDPVSERRKLVTDLRAYFSEYYLFQREDTVKSQFRLMETVYRMDRDYFRKEYKRLEGKFCLSGYVDKRVSELSMGQRRRVELAAILMGEAKLLLLDEPAIGLDERGKRAFWKELQRKKEAGATVLISSHNMAEIEQVCDRILLLGKGKVLYYGDREGLMCRYAPVNRMEIQFEGRIPDMEDLPLLGYGIEDNTLHLSYHADLVTAAEITQRILEQTSIARINIVRQDLTDVIRSLDVHGQTLRSTEDMDEWR